MATVTIRKLDEEVLARLNRREKAHDRSLEGELRAILVREAARPTPAELRAMADRLTAMTPARPQTDAALLVRELRDER